MTRQQDARLLLHDLVCASGCTGPAARDHADRTQHERGRQLAAAAAHDVPQLLHAWSCPWEVEPPVAWPGGPYIWPEGCRERPRHTAWHASLPRVRAFLGLAPLPEDVLRAVAAPDCPAETLAACLPPPADGSATRPPCARP